MPSMISNFLRVSPFKAFLVVVMALVAILQSGIINGWANNRTMAPPEGAVE
jgi:hypothetical protein